MYGFVFNFLKNEQVHFHKQIVINRNLSVGIHDGMGCVICSPLPAYSIQVFTSSFSFKFFQVSDGFKSTPPYKVGARVWKGQQHPEYAFFQK